MVCPNKYNKYKGLKMQLIEEILENGVTQGVCTVAVASALVYVWRRYEKLLSDKSKNSSEKTYNLMKTVQDISNGTQKVVSDVNRTVLDLQAEITNLDNRLRDLERLGYTDQASINALVKDIETIKKYMELYNITMAIKHNQSEHTNN